MTSRHTPGPWHAHADTPGGPDYDTDDVYSPAHGRICRMTGNTATAYQDARLIASAPTMAAEIAALRARADQAEARVAELEAALRETIEQIKRGDVGLPHSPHRRKLMGRMQAALDAARKETP